MSADMDQVEDRVPARCHNSKVMFPVGVSRCHIMAIPEDATLTRSSCHPRLHQSTINFPLWQEHPFRSPISFTYYSPRKEQENKLSQNTPDNSSCCNSSLIEDRNAFQQTQSVLLILTQVKVPFWFKCNCDWYPQFSPGCSLLPNVTNLSLFQDTFSMQAHRHE